MTAQEIISIAEESGFDDFGLRVDYTGVEVGETFPASHQWFQDWQEEWGERPDPDVNPDPDHPYNPVMNCWEDGELPGVCTVGIWSLTEKAVNRALKLIDSYKWGKGYKVYLVGGDLTEGGYDADELIIVDGVALAVID